MAEEEFTYVPAENVEVISPSSPNTAILQLVQNPGMLREIFQLNPQQAENVQALLAGSGTALAVKLFSQHIGVELAGALGGLLGGYASRKVLGG